MPLIGRERPAAAAAWRTDRRLPSSASTVLTSPCTHSTRPCRRPCASTSRRTPKPDASDLTSSSPTTVRLRVSSPLPLMRSPCSGVVLLGRRLVRSGGSSRRPARECRDSCESRRESFSFWPCGGERGRRFYQPDAQPASSVMPSASWSRSQATPSLARRVGMHGEPRSDRLIGILDLAGFVVEHVVARFLSRPVARRSSRPARSSSDLEKISAVAPPPGGGPTAPRSTGE